MVKPRTEKVLKLTSCNPYNNNNMFSEPDLGSMRPYIRQTVSKYFLKCVCLSTKFPVPRLCVSVFVKIPT